MKKISFYIHIPFCLKKCAYCNFYSIPYNSEYTADYIRALTKEIRQFEENDYLVTSIYLGGGTPSLLSFQHLYSVLSIVATIFSVHENAEVTIEANPATITKDRAKEWRILGINRVSIGAQSFIDDELQLLGRLHTAPDISQAVTFVRNACTENISLDLMYGIPGQTHNSWNESLKRAIELQPKHISSYCLSLEKDTPLYEIKDQLSFPDEDVQRDMYYSMISFLEDHNFSQYEISNFSLKDFESQHNISYWMGSEYIGCGAAAHSFYDMTRRENIADVHRYIHSIQNDQSILKSKKEISEREYISDKIFLGLRMRNGISLSSFKTQFGFDIENEYKDTFEKYSKLGYLTIDGDRLKLSHKVLFVSDEILSEFV